MAEIDDFVLTDIPVSRGEVQTRARRRVSGLFLKGPIPWPWIRAAHELGGNALAAGLVLRMFSGLNRGKEFSVSSAKIATLTGVSQGTAKRAVRGLADAGLITVTSTAGRRNEYQIVEVPSVASVS